MKDERTSRVKANGIVSLAYQLVLLVCGFVVPRLMIDAFGSEAYGATVSITQMLAYITLLEGGVGGVARAALYGYLAKKDIEGISAVMAEIQKFFRIVGCIFVAYVVVLAFSFKTISNVECLDQVSSFALVIVISISTVGQYFIGISNSVLLQAAQKTYVSNAISIVATIVNTLCVFLLIYLGFDLVIVKLASSCIFFLRPVLLYLYVRKNYELVKKPRQKKVLQQKWNGLAQHIAFFLHSNTDVVVLTCFANLSLVAVYAVYNMIVSHMQSLVCSCLSGVEALFGDMLAKCEYDQLEQSFNSYETLISVVAVGMFASTAVLIVPFVSLYTAGITDADYIAPAFALLLVLSGMLYCLRMPYHSVVIAAGHFKQTQVSAYGEAAINVALSILFVGNFGLIGVAAATVVGTMFRFVFYVIYLSKHIICRSTRLFVKRSIVNLSAFAVVFLVGNFMVAQVDVSNYFYWALCGAGTLALALIVVLGANYIAYRNEFSAVLYKRLSKQKKQGSES